MTRNIRWAVFLLPDRGIPVLVAYRVPADERKAITLARPFIEFLLVAARSHAVTSNESGPWCLFPNCSIKILSGYVVAAHQFETIALLTDQRVEFFLIGGGGQTVTRNIAWAVLFLPDCCVASFVAN